jgi:hypothetical protein
MLDANRSTNTNTAIVISFIEWHRLTMRHNEGLLTQSYAKLSVRRLTPKVPLAPEATYLFFDTLLRIPTGFAI